MLQWYFQMQNKKIIKKKTWKINVTSSEFVSNRLGLLTNTETKYGNVKRYFNAWC